uniref:Uncharacterized protein n=1 Tax=viral metagenome TaxID=1070528 RepID=A0A6M3KGK2_9ZZZZ
MSSKKITKRDKYPLLERTGHDPDEFRYPVKDSDGHVRIWLSLPTAVSDQIEFIIRSHQFPYAAATDLFRHAVHRHLEWLLSFPTRIKNIMSQINIMREMLIEEDAKAAASEVVEKLATVTDRYIAMRRWKDAQNIAGRIYDQINKSPDSYWRDRMIAEMRMRYGELLDMKFDVETKIKGLEGG